MKNTLLSHCHFPYMQPFTDVLNPLMRRKRLSMPWTLLWTLQSMGMLLFLDDAEKLINTLEDTLCDEEYQ